MKNKVEKKCRGVHLALLFAIIIFTILFLTMLCMFAGMYFLSKMKVELPVSARVPLFTFAIISIIVGTIIAGIVSRIPLSPLREIILATDKLAAGDFNTRIHLNSTGELKKLTQSFNHMAEELGSIEMLRSDFVNNFSHEFKTPIMSIRGFAKMLKYEDLSKEERDDYLGIIISESERLAELATNVLNLSKIENQTILTDKKIYNVSEQIRRSIAILDSKWSEKKIEIKFDCKEFYLNGNEELLGQVWINLIDNAIKFSPKQALIEIKILQENNETVFQISDQGIGISEEHIDKVFEKFYQCDISHTTKGNGLGLTLVKKIVELHGGTIHVENGKQIGSVFEVRIPMNV